TKKLTILEAVSPGCLYLLLFQVKRNINSAEEIMSILVAETLQLNSDVDNSTQPPDWAGFTATGIAVLFYGSNYVPVKKFDTGDGMLFQFFLCLGIWLVGMAVNAIRAFPLFHPTVLLGGAIWTFGNLFAVPIIQTIGMGLGILIWGMFNMLTGWATGRFGVLGIPPQVPNSLAFNYAGVAISAVASVLFFFTAPVPAAPQQLQKQPFWLQMSPLRRRIFPRIILPAIVSGMMWGVAGASWFLANQVLSESISYPIISSAPAIVAALWSVCVFREIRAARESAAGLDEDIAKAEKEIRLLQLRKEAAQLKREIGDLQRECPSTRPMNRGKGY
uniref:Transmembrane protein 144 n=1 Tax=Macrostomum lignano TaxID=282301 RepID=A0A1I8HMV9_9PLAT